MAEHIRRVPAKPKQVSESAVTSARFVSFHGLSVARMPLDHTRSTPQNCALVTSGHPQSAA